VWSGEISNCKKHSEIILVLQNAGCKSAAPKLPPRIPKKAHHLQKIFLACVQLKTNWKARVLAEQP
jgi:hypothetical protein